MYKPLLFATGLLLSSVMCGPNSARAQDYDSGNAPNNYQQQPYSSYPDADSNGRYNEQYGQNPPNQQRYGTEQGAGYGQANRQGPLPREAIEDMLRRQNFGDFRNFESKGNVYKVTAVDQRGQLYRLSVDAYTGRIIDAKRKES
jgi:uncharacterized membrane protein YkoI